MLKRCEANRKRRLSALPNVSPYIYTTLKFLALQGAPHIYDISRLRVNALLQFTVNRRTRYCMEVFVLRNDFCFIFQNEDEAKQTDTLHIFLVHRSRSVVLVDHLV
jgi:hypothetical protein